MVVEHQPGRTTMNIYTQRLRAAATYMDEHGWTQGTEKNNAGQVCLTGAIRFCAPQNGDDYLIRAVLRHRNQAETWNDQNGRTDSEVLDILRTAEITDADLAEVFGPNWSDVVVLIRQCASLTADQVSRAHSAWGTAGAAARDAAWGTARGAAWDAAWDAARAAAWDAARAAALDTDWGTARAAALAAGAIIVKDLITPEHFDILTAAWNTVIGG
jgi:hypothetical protein